MLIKHNEGYKINANQRKKERKKDYANKVPPHQT